MSTLFNVLISGVSVSGDLDTTATSLTITMGNSDKVGNAEFELQNTQGIYSRLLLSGNATVQIDVVQNQIPSTLFRGTLETITPQIDLKSKKGSTVLCKAYNFGQEMLNVVSPDARIPYLLTISGTQNVLSGDGGVSSPDGMDLVLYTSGTGNVLSGSVTVTVAQFMSQWMGNINDPTGSVFGQLFSYKPYIPGYNWRTYYVPDASGYVAANDNNSNYYLLQDQVKAKREYAWDTLRKITRSQLAVDQFGNPVQFELYTDVSGGIHMFASGSYEIFLSGISLVYYTVGYSGSQNNNLVDAQIPFDLTQVKNYIDGWFPDWTQYPYNSDIITSQATYPVWWSGSNENQGVTQISGTTPASPFGTLSVMGTNTIATGTNASGGFSLIYTVYSGVTINVLQWNISGAFVPTTLNYLWKWSGTGAANILPIRFVGLYDNSGNSIMKSGAEYPGGGPPVPTGPNAVSILSGGSWIPFTDVIFTSGGVFQSGTGQDGGWKTNLINSNPFFDFSNIKQLSFGLGFAAGDRANNWITSLWVDEINFQFDYPFSPIVAFNSGSQGMYGRRYAVVEWPYEVSSSAASGLINGELLNRMGSQAVATFTVRDNPALSPAQLTIKPGYVFVVDSPSLNTGSGQTFNYWRASSVKHSWDKIYGFETTIQAYPFFSGITLAPYQNNINYTTPNHYSNPVPSPPAEHEQYMPFGRFWVTGGR